jgi:hypothetical protein
MLRVAEAALRIRQDGDVRGRFGAEPQWLSEISRHADAQALRVLPAPIESPPASRESPTNKAVKRTIVMRIRKLRIERNRVARAERDELVVQVDRAIELPLIAAPAALAWITATASAHARQGSRVAGV